MEVNVLNIKGEDTGRKVTLNESIFGIEPNDHAIYLDVKQFMANQRQGTHKSKERSEISGSTRKLGRQKGGGGARRGDINSPVLTEPIMKLEVVTPEENMGDVIGDLNKRRGQVEGMESSRSGARIVKAKVPLAEMFGYVTALRTITSGRATSSMTYDHHAQVSSSIAKAVLEEVKGRVDLV